MSADPKKKEIDDVTGIDTTGHEWDGIKELNYPLPRWWLNTFYGTVLVLIVAYVLHFLPAGLQSLEPSIQQITPNVEEVARTLGLGVRETWRRVTLPLIRNGVIVAWVLIFLQTMKELPATLLLRPVGFDTLPIRVWLEASEEYYQLAAPSALLIVLVGLPALFLLLSRDWRAA